MTDKLYLVGVEFCEPCILGPYDSVEERDKEAREYMDGACAGDTNIFKLYVDEDRNVTMAPYLEEELDGDDE